MCLFMFDHCWWDAKINRLSTGSIILSYNIPKQNYFNFCLEKKEFLFEMLEYIIEKKKNSYFQYFHDAVMALNTTETIIIINY